MRQMRALRTRTEGKRVREGSMQWYNACSSLPGRPVLVNPSQLQQLSQLSFGHFQVLLRRLSNNSRRNGQRLALELGGTKDGGALEQRNFVSQKVSATKTAWTGSSDEKGSVPASSRASRGSAPLTGAAVGIQWIGRKQGTGAPPMSLLGGFLVFGGAVLLGCSASLCSFDNPMLTA